MSPPPSRDVIAAADWGIPLTFDQKNQVISSPSAILLTIPPDARPGEMFAVSINGRTLRVTCPLDMGPGDLLRVASNVRRTVTLPTGNLGFCLRGKKTARISRLEPFSPLRDSLEIGMKVISLEIPGDAVYTKKLNATRLASLLTKSMDVENRKLVVMKPLLMNDP